METLELILPRREAEALERRLSPVCEDADLPLTLSEASADGALWCVSVQGESAALDGFLADGPAAEAALPWQRRTVPDVDWIARSLDGLGPVRAGPFVVHGSHAASAVRAGETGVLIEAGEAFGTGHHGTTAGCLVLLAAELRRRRVTTALDLGSGSGVLAIALALRVRSARVIASDIDPVATRVARDNVEANGVAGRVRCVTSTGFGHRAIAGGRPYELILANILARPLELLMPGLGRHINRRGLAIVSGLLPHQQARIVSAARLQGLRLERALIREGWLSLALRRG